MTESSHSLFGFIWQIVGVTGWSVDYIINKVNYQTLVRMMVDAPRPVRKNSEPSRTIEEESNEIIQYFQSFEK